MNMRAISFWTALGRRGSAPSPPGTRRQRPLSRNARPTVPPLQGGAEGAYQKFTVWWPRQRPQCAVPLRVLWRVPDVQRQMSVLVAVVEQASQMIRGCNASSSQNAAPLRRRLLAACGGSIETASGTARLRTSGIASSPSPATPLISPSPTPAGAEHESLPHKRMMVHGQNLRIRFGQSGHEPSLVDDN